jgi:hypothetical protein
MNTPAKFRQKDLEKAIRAAEKLGKTVMVKPDGSFVIISKDGIAGKADLKPLAPPKEYRI